MHNSLIAPAFNLKWLDDSRVWSAGVDYLTISGRNESNVTQKVRDITEEHYERRSIQGYEPRKTGFRGYTGLHIEGQTVLRNDVAWVVQWSSDTAQEMATRVSELGGSFNVTRLDFHTTFKLTSDRPGAASDLRTAIRRYEKATDVKRPANLDLFDRPGVGSTLNLGSVKSDRTLKFYDKWREQQEKVEPWLWRLESKNCGPYAPPLFDALAANGSGSDMAMKVVSSHAQTFGLQSKIFDTEPLRMPSTYRQPDDARFIEYFVRVHKKRLTHLKRYGGIEALSEALQVACGLAIVSIDDGLV